MDDQMHTVQKLKPTLDTAHVAGAIVITAIVLVAAMRRALG